MYSLYMHLNLFLYHNDSDGRLLDYSICLFPEVVFCTFLLHRAVMAQIRLLGSNDGALKLRGMADTNVQTVGQSRASYLDQGGVEVGSFL